MRLFEGTEFDVPPRCERCDELEADCQCGPLPPERRPPEEQTASVVKEKRARGKLVTVVTGLTEPDTDMKQLLSTLKTACGAGGTIRGDTLELQGNQVARTQQALRTMGFNVR
jgi:translation initiation factor 1